MFEVNAVQFYSLGPNWFEDYFVYENFVACGEVLLPSKYPMHFGERHSQLLPFCEYVFAPGKSPVEVQPEIFLRCLNELTARFIFFL
jgi:hypothetical protein